MERMRIQARGNDPFAQLNGEVESIRRDSVPELDRER